MASVTTMPMDELIAAFVRHLEIRQRSPRTIKHYGGTMAEFSAYLRRELGDTFVAIEVIGRREIAAFLELNTRNEKRPSPAVWNIKLAAIRCFFAFLFKEEVVSVNPALQVERLRAKPKELSPLSLDEHIRLVEVAGTAAPRLVAARNIAVLQVLFHCSLRVAELVSLDLQQVDFENHVFWNVRVKGGKQLGVRFSDLVAEALERYLVTRDKLAATADELALFLSARRRRMSVRAVQHLVRTYCWVACPSARMLRSRRGSAGTPPC